MLKIMRAADSAREFARWQTDSCFATLDVHPIFGAFGRQYYPAVFDGICSDESFAVLSHDKPVVLVPCAAIEGTLDYYGTPVSLFRRTDLPPELASSATAAALKHIDEIAVTRGINRVILRDDGGLGALSVVGEECLGRQYMPAVRLSALAELKEGETGLRRSLRKSYKSLLNWGRNNLRTDVI
ncbi:MAG: hypothetical protein ACREPW_01365, partial [Candidatus Binataceae bacterium]